MNRKISFAQKNIISAVITLILLLIFVFSGPVYSNAGDGSIAKYLASNAEPGFNSISWGIGAFLKIFVHLFPSVNWWTIFSIFMLFSCLYLLTLFIQEQFDGIGGVIIAILFAFFMWEVSYSIEINFTQTAILSGITGTSALLMMWHRSKGFGRIVYGFIGILYILISGSLRFNAMILCIPFSLVVLTLRLLLIKLNAKSTEASTSEHSLKRSFILKDSAVNISVFLPFTIIILVVCGSYGVHQIYRHINPDIAFFEDTFDLTREVYDYLDMYPEYDEVSDVYEAAGITKSWSAMLSNYYIADTNYFNIETLSVPVQFKGASTLTFKGYMSDALEHKGALFLALIVIVTGGILISFRNMLIPLVSAIAVFLVSGLYFVHVGRYAWRVTSGVIAASVVMALMMVEVLSSEILAQGEDELKAFPANKENKLFASGTKNGNIRKRFSAAVIIVVVSFIYVSGHIITSKSFEMPQSKVTDTATANLLDYMDSNSDIVYFTEDLDYSSHNLWYVQAPGYLDNKFTVFAGYNEGRNKDLQAYGISDMSAFVINMLTRNDIYTVYTNEWAAYLCDYYNPYVSAGIVDVFEETGTQFIRYVAPVETISDSYDDSVSEVSLYVDGNMQTDNYQVIHVDAKVSTAEEDTEYYLNIENASTGAIYSYPLVRDGESLIGDAIWKNDTWNFGETSQYIVARNSDGTAVRILDITGTPVPFN